jgi:hypothetical protein
MNGVKRFVDPPIQSDEVTACTQREPVQIDAGTEGATGNGLFEAPAASAMC